MEIAKIFYDEGIENVVMMPDSLISKCVCSNDLQQYGIDFIQTLNESDAVCISSGLNLTGSRTVCMMENSGIRSACDIISRFELGHGIHNIYILTNRGNIGEENWWGVCHNEVTNEILKAVKMKTIAVKSIEEFCQAIHNAIKTFRTEQASVTIFLEYSFFEEIK